MSGVRSSWDTEATNSSLTAQRPHEVGDVLVGQGRPGERAVLGSRADRADTDSARRVAGSEPTQSRTSSNSSPMLARCDGRSGRAIGVSPSAS